MSDNIPFDIHVEIIKRLPLKSLIQFRSVSKPWKSLIDSSDFIARYSSQQQHLLVRYQDLVDLEQKYVSIVDDNTFPQHRVSLTPPPLVRMLKDPSNMSDESSILGSSHGLLCFSGYCKDGLRFSLYGMPMVVLWNISIRKAVVVVVPNARDVKYRTALGFGVCRETTDPKIVHIRYIRSPGVMESVNGFLYGLAIDRITMDGGFTSHNLIISFDVTSEEFREVNLPHSLAHDVSERMEFWKSGEPVIEFLDLWCDPLEESSSLVVYEPDSKQTDNLRIDGISSFSFSGSSYMETLLLLDQPNFVIYGKAKATSKAES
ncbi:hypothetical protein L1987_46264 [Smallanthus sonchifolius]|uniref:Uncharacterized protein n=1 Tax=Smallanthus sonchifolius TaxID=185202 RepID=A0ACB9FZB0_9ASTR|nr:hypothetical protein L1987_46264 [Smallanthus sonchifolius]